MRKIRLDTLVLLRAASFLVLFTVQAIHAADPAAPSVDTKLPPQFATFQAQGFANMYGQCSPLANTGAALGNIAQGNYSSNPFNAALGGGACNGSETPPQSGSPLQCRDILRNGKPDEELIKKKQQGLQELIGTISCKVNGLNEVNSQINCLVSEGQNVTRQVASMQAMFLSNMQRFQADVRTINQDIKDRENQYNDAKRYIEGDGPSRPGLAKLKEATETAVNKTVPDSIKSIEEAIHETDKQKGVLEADIQSETISSAMDCFEKKTDPSWRCARNGPPVSAKQYILCRYQQNQSLGKDGKTIEDKSSVAADALGNQAGLASLLDEIATNTPRKSQIGGPQDGSGADAGVKLFRSVDEIITNYKDQLSGFNGKGLDISAFAVRQLQSCNVRAQRYVQVMRTHKPSRVYNAEYQLQVMQRNNQRESKKFMDIINQVYTEDVRGLTGLSVPLNTTGCENQPMDVVISCMQNLQKNLNGLLMGNIPNSSMNVQLKARTAANNITFQCAGLNGCLSSMTNVKDNLQREGQRIQAFKVDYVGKANANVDQFVQQMANKIAPLSTQLNDKINQLNGKLSALGVPRIRVKGIEPEPLTGDPELGGLYKTPQNALAVVAGKGKMNPPLPDLSADGFSEGLDAIPKRISDLNDKLAAAQGAMAEIAGMASKCKVETIASKSSSFSNNLVNADSSHCFYQENFCKIVGPLGGAGSVLPDIGADDTGSLKEDADSVDEQLSTGMNICHSYGEKGGSYSSMQKKKHDREYDRLLSEWSKRKDEIVARGGKPEDAGQAPQNSVSSTGEEVDTTASCDRVANRLVKDFHVMHGLAGDDSNSSAGE